MFHSPNDAAPLESRISQYAVMFRRPNPRPRPLQGCIPQHRDLRRLLVYFTGAVHTQIKPFNKITVESKIYFALFLFRLHL